MKYKALTFGFFFCGALPAFASSQARGSQKILVHREISDELHQTWLATGTYRGYLSKTSGGKRERCEIVISAGDPTNTLGLYAYQHYSIKLGKPEWIQPMYKTRPLRAGKADLYEPDVWYSSQTDLVDVGPHSMAVTKTKIKFRHRIKGTIWDDYLSLSFTVNEAWEPTVISVKKSSLGFATRVGYCTELRRTK